MSKPKTTAKGKAKAKAEGTEEKKEDLIMLPRLFILHARFGDAIVTDQMQKYINKDNRVVVVANSTNFVGNTIDKIPVLVCIFGVLDAMGNIVSVGTRAALEYRVMEFGMEDATRIVDAIFGGSWVLGAAFGINLVTDKVQTFVRPDGYFSEIPVNEDTLGHCMAYVVKYLVMVYTVGPMDPSDPYASLRYVFAKEGSTWAPHISHTSLTAMRGGDSSSRRLMILGGVMGNAYVTGPLQSSVRDNRVNVVASRTIFTGNTWKGKIALTAIFASVGFDNKIYAVGTKVVEENAMMEFGLDDCDRVNSADYGKIWVAGATYGLGIVTDKTQSFFKDGELPGIIPVNSTTFGDQWSGVAKILTVVYCVGAMNPKNPYSSIKMRIQGENNTRYI